MTKVHVSFTRTMNDAVTLRLDAAPDDIGEQEVFEALKAHEPFDEIEITDYMIETEDNA